MCQPDPSSVRRWQMQHPPKQQLSGQIGKSPSLQCMRCTYLGRQSGQEAVHTGAALAYWLALHAKSAAGKPFISAEHLKHICKAGWAPPVVYCLGACATQSMPTELSLSMCSQPSCMYGLTYGLLLSGFWARCSLSLGGHRLKRHHHGQQAQQHCIVTLHLHFRK